MNNELPCQPQSHLPSVILLNQSERKINGRGSSRACIKKSIFYEEGSGINAEFRKPRGNIFGEAPVRYDLPAVEQTGRCKRVDTSAKGRDTSCTGRSSSWPVCDDVVEFRIVNST